MTRTLTTRQLEGAELDVLLAYLEDETRLQENLLAVLEKTGAALVQQDLPALQASLEESAKLVPRLEETTRRRASLFKGIVRRLGLLSEDVPLSSIESFVADDAGRAALARARRNLRHIVEKIANQNRRNHLLVRTGLEINEGLIRSFFGHAEPSRTYDRSARAQNSAPIRPCVNREA